MIFLLGLYTGAYLMGLVWIVSSMLEVNRSMKRIQSNREEMEKAQAQALRWWEDWERR